MKRSLTETYELKGLQKYSAKDQEAGKQKRKTKPNSDER